MSAIYMLCCYSIYKNYSIFGGYVEEQRTKVEHLWRSAPTTHVDVKVKNTIHVTHRQAQFHSNSKNKIQLISLLMTNLEEAGCKVLQADGYAKL